MSKPLKFYQTLNQAPRSARQHGKHWRTSPPAYGSPVVGTDHSAGRSTTVYSWSTIGSALTWNEPEPPKPPTVPYAGIRTGELIGYRLWWLLPQGISSLAHKRIWEPGETVEGNLDETVNIFGTIWGGTYAFHDPSSLDREASEGLAAIRDWQRLQQSNPWMIMSSPFRWEGSSEAIGLVTGTIKMWGEVVEHERGYRAQFAKLNRLDAIYGEGDINALRAKYGVA